MANSKKSSRNLGLETIEENVEKAGRNTSEDSMLREGRQKVQNSSSGNTGNTTSRLKSGKVAHLSEADIERAEFIDSDAALITILNPGEENDSVQNTPDLGARRVHNQSSSGYTSRSNRSLSIPAEYPHQVGGGGGEGVGEDLAGLREGEIIEFGEGERGIVLNLHRNGSDSEQHRSGSLRAIFKIEISEFDKIKRLKS